jgi:ribonuclease HI
MWHRHPACVALGVTYSFSIRLPAPCTNNLAEYEAARRGMELLFEDGAEAVEVFWGFKVQMREQITVPIMDAMSRANDTIQIHKFLLDTKSTEC